MPDGAVPENTGPEDTGPKNTGPDKTVTDGLESGAIRPGGIKPDGLIADDCLCSRFKSLISCSGLPEACNGLARIARALCEAACAVIYLRDYTGEHLIATGGAPCTVTSGQETLLSSVMNDVSHPLAYCMQTGKSLTLSASSQKALFPSLSVPSAEPAPAYTGKNSERPTCAADLCYPDLCHSDLCCSANGLTPANLNSFYPLIAPGNNTIGVMVTRHGNTPVVHPADILALCLYGSAIIDKFINERRNRALVQSLNHDLKRYNDESQAEERLSRVISGSSPQMAQLRKLIHRAATAEVSVFITGETGTGKSLAAKTIHEASSRSGKPFMAINCGAIPDNLLESSLFGHVKGAFSGAVTNHTGLLRAANGGTVFFDEIGELPVPLQVALLHAVQERTVRPVGSVRSYPIDVRIISATNKPIDEALESGSLRQDLYHRLSGLNIHISPLRERPEDIACLAEQLVAECCLKHGKNTLRLTPQAVQKLKRLPLRGNVRELSNILEQCVVLAQSNSGQIEETDFLAHAGVPQQVPSSASLNSLMEDYEVSVISTVLDRCGGDITASARELEVHPRTLARRISKYGIFAAAQDRERGRKPHL